MLALCARVCMYVCECSCVGVWLGVVSALVAGRLSMIRIHNGFVSRAIKF